MRWALDAGGKTCFRSIIEEARPAPAAARFFILENNHGFQMGKVGGARPGAGRKPGQVSQAKLAIAKEAQKHGAMALQVLVDLAKGAESEQVRQSAANAILDRGYGKPFVSGPGDDGEHLVTVKVEADEAFARVVEALDRAKPGTAGGG